MKKLIRNVLVLFAVSLPMSSVAVDNVPQDNNSAVVHLRTNCNETGNSLASCFESMSSLKNWITNIRQRSASNPLVVEIGPGTFDIFECYDDGYISLKGSGRGVTVIQGQFNGMSLSANCNLNVQDLTVSDSGFSLVGAINVGSNAPGGAVTTWNNVDVIGTNYGWTDSGNWSTAGDRPTHFWFNSRITVRRGFLNIARGYSTSAENWFFATQINAIANLSNAETIGVLAKQGAEIHVYGGNIRAIAEAGAILPDAAMNGTFFRGLIAVGAQDSGTEVHIHGTGIDVLSIEGNNVAALVGRGNASIHATSSSYAMKTGTNGSLSRILDEGGLIAKASYLWEEGTPPDITSKNGSDMVVTTDNADNQPHLVLYSDNCPSKWFDTVTGACR